MSENGHLTPTFLSVPNDKLVHDLTSDEVFDYTRKRGVEHSEIVLPTAVAARMGIEARHYDLTQANRRQSHLPATATLSAGLSFDGTPRQSSGWRITNLALCGGDASIWEGPHRAEALSPSVWDLMAPSPERLTCRILVGYRYRNSCRAKSGWCVGSERTYHSHGQLPHEVYKS